MTWSPTFADLRTLEGVKILWTKHQNSAKVNTNPLKVLHVKYTSVFPDILDKLPLTRERTETGLFQVSCRLWVAMTPHATALKTLAASSTQQSGLESVYWKQNRLFFLTFIYRHESKNLIRYLVKDTVSFLFLYFCWCFSYLMIAVSRKLHLKLSWHLKWTCPRNIIIIDSN